MRNVSLLPKISEGAYVHQLIFFGKAQKEIYFKIIPLELCQLICTQNFMQIVNRSQIWMIYGKCPIFYTFINGFFN